MRILSSLTRSLVATLVIAAPVLSAHPVAAQTAPTLIKGTTSSSVYYVNSGKRYAFPNERVYKSWYADFSGVATVSDSELASYQLAGNVTYRPGIKLVKIQTDPKVYAVSKYGILRWVSTENIASLLYGQNWNTKVDDVADTFFTNYIIGDPVDGTHNYAVVDELLVTNIGQNIRPSDFNPNPTTPAPTPVGDTSVVVTISSSEATLNQMLLVFANVTSPATITKLEIYSDQQPAPLATCLNATNCSVNYTIAQTPLTARFRAIAYDSTGKTYQTSLENQASLNVPASSSDIQMSVSPLTLTAGTRASFTSNALTFTNISSHKIYAHIPGEANPVLWADCGIQDVCSGSTPFYRTTQLYSKIVTGGQTYRSASVTVTVTNGAAPKPVLTLVSKPTANQVTLKLDAPSGETIGWSSIVQGTSPENDALAICQLSSCEVTVQFSGAATFTAFTDVGGKLEASNSVTVTQ